MLASILLLGCGARTGLLVDEEPGPDAAVPVPRPTPPPMPVPACAPVDGLLVPAGETFVFDTRRGPSTMGTSCGAPAPGNEAFLGVDMRAGERWHLHLVQGGSGGNASIALADGCDGAGCRAFADACATSDEHFDYVAERDGPHWLRVDDAEAGGHDYAMLAVRDVCGDGVVSLGETCDTEPDCDDQCRRVILSGDFEAEPNESAVRPNVLVNQDSVELRGVIGSDDCSERDVFEVLIESGRVDAEFLSPDCAPDVSLRLLDGDRETVAVSEPDPATACARLEGRGLRSGHHYLAVETERGVPNTSYQLRVRR